MTGLRGEGRKSVDFTGLPVCAIYIAAVGQWIEHRCDAQILVAEVPTSGRVDDYFKRADSPSVKSLGSSACRRMANRGQMPSAPNLIGLRYRRCNPTLTAPLSLQLERIPTSQGEGREFKFHRGRATPQYNMFTLHQLLRHFCRALPSTCVPRDPGVSRRGKSERTTYSRRRE